MKTHTKPSYKSLTRQVKDKNSILNHIRKQIEKGTGESLKILKEKYAEDKLFYLALSHVTTTKKALCTALNIPVEAGCRYKRSYEKNGYLAQSTDVYYCPFTKHLAHKLSTNPEEFERLRKPKVIQLRLF
jgi:hypothetical protein